MTRLWNLAKEAERDWKRTGLQEATVEQKVDINWIDRLVVVTIGHDPLLFKGRQVLAVRAQDS